MLIGFNLTFGPMHVLGLQGMIRRISRYPESLGLTFWNQVSSVGAFMIAAGRPGLHRQRGRRLAPQATADGHDPWDAPHDRVDDVLAAARVQLRGGPAGARARRLLAPQVRGDRQERGGAGAGGRRAATTTRGHDDAGHGIHLPNPSFCPIVSAVGLPILGYGAFDPWCGSRRRRGRRHRRASSGGPSSPRRRSTDGHADRHLDRHGRPGARRTSTGLPNVKLAMWLFLASECLLFGALISTYLLYRGREHRGAVPRRRVRHPLHVGRRRSCCWRAR